MLRGFCLVLSLRYIALFIFDKDITRIVYDMRAWLFSVKSVLYVCQLMKLFVILNKMLTFIINQLWIHSDTPNVEAVK